jgi:hypothetical protein
MSRSLQIRPCASIAPLRRRAENKKAAGQASARTRDDLNGSFACERPSLGAVGFLMSRNRATSAATGLSRQIMRLDVSRGISPTGCKTKE